LLRKILGIPVAGVFIAKTGHQLGAIKLGQFHSIQIAVLEQGSVPPGFNITFLRYDEERERRSRDIAMGVAPGSYVMTGFDAGLVHGKAIRRN
jgi:hypothetical protein